MTKNSAVKRAARKYMDEHGVPYTVAVRRVKRLRLGDRVRELPGDGVDIKDMPIGVVEFIGPTGGIDVKYSDGTYGTKLGRSDLEAVTI